jgi:hypothetical protein
MDMKQCEGLIEQLRVTPVTPDAFTDLWATLIAGDESQLTIQEISRERLAGKLEVRLRFIDGREYDVVISDARKWV